MKKIPIIVDTDPGVDDAQALIYLFKEPKFDLKLFVVNNANIHVEKAERNLNFLLDTFNVDVPSVRGYHRLGKSSEFAYHMHGAEGLGHYKIKTPFSKTCIDADASDAIYEILKANPKKVVYLELGSHSNLAYLFMKHPDSKDLIKRIVMMGGAPSGIRANSAHKSFNIRTDAPAFQHTIDSGVPVVMCPSSIGRDVTYLTYEQVQQVKKTNSVGKMLGKMFETYWEPGYKEKIIATCDLAAAYYIVHPRLYRTYKASVTVDTKKDVGRIIAKRDKNGQFRIIKDVNREKFIKLLFDDLKKYRKKEIPGIKKALK